MNFNHDASGNRLGPRKPGPPGHGGKGEKPTALEADDVPARSVDPVVHDVSPNEVRVDTAGGSTEIVGADPKAKGVLQQHKARLAKILASAALTPASI